MRSFTQGVYWTSFLALTMAGIQCGSSSPPATPGTTSGTTSGTTMASAGSGVSGSGSGTPIPTSGSGVGSGAPSSGTPSSGVGMMQSGDDSDGSPGPVTTDAGGSDDATMASDAMSGTGGGDAQATGCGTRTGMRGKTTRTLMVDGKSRTYVAYLPSSANATTPVPFVYAFHGATQTGADMVIITQYQTIADSDGIAVVFPDGQGTSSVTGSGALNPWNVSDNKAAVCGAGDLVNNGNAVDFDFMDAIKADISQDQCLDSKHMFATGFSMGGYFTHHIACDRTDIRGAAPHSGGTMASLSTCKTNHMPIIIFHGTSDPLIADACDDPTATPQSGFPASATLWAAKNGCQTTYTTTMENGPTSGKDGQCYLYNGCPADGQVELCTFTSMPHAWAGAAMCPGCIGSGAGYADATALEWAFFKKYAWN